MPGFKTTFILLFNLIKTNMRNVTSREGEERMKKLQKNVVSLILGSVEE